jgi:hypothetical protein
LVLKKTVISYAVKGAELTKKTLTEIDIAEETQKGKFSACTRDHYLTSQ